MYSYISNKYNRMLYILLCIYIILVFVFSLLFNDFFVKPKAIEIDSNYYVGYKLTYQGNVSNGNISFEPRVNGDSRLCVVNDPDIISAFETNGISGGLCIAQHNCGITINSAVGDAGYGLSYNYSWTNQIANNYLNSLDSSYTTYMGLIYIPGLVNIEANKSMLQDLSNISEIGWVDNFDDLKAYMKNNDDSDVNYTDPDDQPIDSQIPTPQKVAVYKDSSSPSLVWSNPRGITNNDNIKVHIEWKPVITLTNGLYDVQTITTQDYQMLYFDNIGDYNSFCTLNNNGSPPPNVLNSYNTIYDSKVLFSGNGAQQSNDWANQLIIENNISGLTRVDPFGISDILGKGFYSGVRVPDLKYRIRYETDSGVSDWIYSDREFDSDNVSGPSQHSSTHSRNASGDPVSNPTYTPNNDNKVIPQNEVDDQNDSDKNKSNSIFDFISGFFDTIISAITSIFAKLKEIVDSISNGTGSFFSFFADLFGAFPQLLGIFLLGLVVTVLLRVLGR